MTRWPSNGVATLGTVLAVGATYHPVTDFQRIVFGQIGVFGTTDSLVRLAGSVVTVTLLVRQGEVLPATLAGALDRAAR